MSRLVLIDGHAILHRAYHAYPPLTTSQGELVGAVYGFTSILLTVLKKLHPEYVAVAFDKKAPTFRHKKFKEYKLHRPKMAEELADQLPRVHEVVEALNIPIFEKEGYEADDVIGTLVRQAAEVTGGVVRNAFLASSPRDTVKPGSSATILLSPSESNSRKNMPAFEEGQGARIEKAHKIGQTSPNYQSTGPNAHIAKNGYFTPPQKESLEIVIVTGDQDALQLVDENIKVYMPARGKQPEQIFDPEAVGQKYGVEPRQIVDLKALSGDQSDGIPGVKGIGPKTAKNLLVKFGKLGKIYKRLAVVSAPVAEKLKAGRQNAFLSEELATINRRVPIEFNLARCLLKDYDKGRVLKLFGELEFKSLIKKLPGDGWEEEVEEIMNGKQDSAKTQKDNKDAKIGKQMGLF